MKLRTQLSLFGLAGLLPAALMAGIGLYSTNLLFSEVVDATVAGKAMQVSQHADMMHDAIRGDAQLAILGAHDSNAAMIQDAIKQVGLHGDEFNAQMTLLESMPLSEHTRQALAKVKPALKQYLADANSVAHAAATDAAAAQSKLAALNRSFGVMEELMGGLSDSISEQVAMLNEEAVTAVRSTQTALLFTLLATAVSLAISSWWLAKKVSKPFDEVANVADRMAAGDLSARIDVQGNEESVRLLKAMSGMQQNLIDIIGGVRASAESVATASSQIAEGNLDLSQRTAIQATSLSQTTSAVSHMEETVKLNTENATQANQLARGASAVAVRGGDVVGQVVETMKGINQSSQKIADIISVIDGIAFQTNILALNAAVEAARAGEQGRGFAVVASEVRSLAQRSANAAKEINALITASVSRVLEGSKLVDEAGSTMNEVVSSIQRVTDIMGEISSASAEQSQGIDLVGQAISQMDQSTQSNAALVEESSAAANSLRSQAHQLVESVGVFKLA
jgi:methyl-accepting chemotaxis protein